MAYATQSFLELLLEHFQVVLFCFRLCVCCRIFRRSKLASGVPQMRSRLMHHGLPSFRKPRKRFLGSSKKYSTFSAASSTLLFSLSVRKKYSFLASQTSLWWERQQVGYSCLIFVTLTKALWLRSSSTTSMSASRAKTPMKMSCVFGEFYFVIEWSKNWDASALCCPKIVFAVSRRKMHHACGCFNINEVFADDFVDKGMFGFKFCLFRNHVF